LSRAAFLLDRLMSSIGLSGKAFVPLLSSFACAVPGIMATRTIPNRKDRLVTILIAPLMACSARLPVYILLIGTVFEAERRVFGLFNLGGLIMLGLYLGGILGAVGSPCSSRRRF
jgi:ferrous iron transport protein B